jgi:hypothetical protein
MFDSRHAFQLLLNSEQAAALVKVHPKHLLTGFVACLRGGKFWRFRASHFDGWSQDAERAAIDSQLEQRYSVLNHSCPQQSRR